MTSSPSSRTSYTAAPREPLADDDPLLAFEPVPHKAPRRNSITAARQRKFIAELAATGIVRQAALSIGASLEALYRLRHKPGGEAFAAAWDEAVDRGIARLEDCALQRAIEGVERPIVSGGKLLGWQRVHNEGLVMFLLRSRRGNRYGTGMDSLRPGHPVYERIRQEVLEAERGDEAEVIESIDRFIEDMRQRRLANAPIIAEMEARRIGDEPGRSD